MAVQTGRRFEKSDPDWFDQYWCEKLELALPDNEDRGDLEACKRAKVDRLYLQMVSFFNAPLDG